MTSLDDDDDEERFIDIDRIEELKNAKTPKPPKNATTTHNQQQSKHSTEYDPFKRDPRFANAENSPMLELVMLSQHAHPTVRLWATQLMSGQLVSYNGDPL